MGWASARRARAVLFLVLGGTNRRRCGDVEIARLAISKGGGRRWETRCRAWTPRKARREFSTDVHGPAFPQRSPVLIGRSGCAPGAPAWPSACAVRRRCRCCAELLLASSAR